MHWFRDAVSGFRDAKCFLAKNDRWCRAAETSLRGLTQSLPYLSLGKVRDEDAAVIRRMGEVEFRCHLPKDIPQDRRSGELTHLVENGAGSLRPEVLVLARVKEAPDTPTRMRWELLQTGN
jgi:hypothetical protein